MNISVFGLGYVGIVAAGCMASEGHQVIGVDPNPTKVDLMNQGVSPIVEQDIGKLVKSAVSLKRLTATHSVADAVNATQLLLICVGTPSERTGALDLRYVRKVCEEIGVALRNIDDYKVIVIRSTILPGSMRNLVIPTLESSSGKTAGRDFGVCNNPEFLREGTAVYDYRNPPKTVIGENDSRSGDVVATLYSHLDAPLIRTQIEVAEMVKYVDNVWHAVKVSFANEIGNFCKEIDIDSHAVMDIFCKDTKLNLSPYYLKPGFAFGGSCLPKDLRAITHKAKSLEIQLPLIESVLISNELQIKRALDTIIGHGAKRIGLLGFSFKAGTDDLRESPVVELIERLIGKGIDLRLYDKNVNLAALTGANRDYILNHIPHISRLMVETPSAAIDFAELIIVGNSAPEFKDILEPVIKTKPILDLVRVSPELRSAGSYQGICW